MFSGLFMEEKMDDTKKLRAHHFIGGKKLWKYMGGLLSSISDKEDLENRTKKCINDIIIFNIEHIIKSYNITQ